MMENTPESLFNVVVKELEQYCFGKFVDGSGTVLQEGGMLSRMDKNMMLSCPVFYTDWGKEIDWDFYNKKSERQDMEDALGEILAEKDGIVLPYDSFFVIFQGCIVYIQNKNGWMASFFIVEGDGIHTLSAIIKNDNVDVERGFLRAFSGHNPSGDLEDTNYFNELVRDESLCLCKLHNFLSSINKEGQFIVSSVRRGHRIKNKKIARANDRPSYTLLNIDNIKRLGFLKHAPERDGTGKVIKYRRAHLRRLMSEFYTKKRGEVIKIPAIWHGDNTLERDNKIYKVIGV